VEFLIEQTFQDFWSSLKRPLRLPCAYSWCL